MPENLNQQNPRPSNPPEITQPTEQELQDKLKALREEQSNFTDKTDRWQDLEIEINKIEEQLNRPQ